MKEKTAWLILAIVAAVCLGINIFDGIISNECRKRCLGAWAQDKYIYIRPNIMGDN